MALLAYEEPEKSPMFHLLSLDYRQQVADSLNRAILGLLPKFLHASVFHISYLFPFLENYFMLLS